MLENMITILVDSIVNIIVGELMWPFDEHKNLDNEQGIHVNSKYHKESGYGLILDSLTISLY